MEREEVARLQRLVYGRDGDASAEQIDLLHRYQNQISPSAKPSDQDLDETPAHEGPAPIRPAAEAEPPPATRVGRTRKILIACALVASGVAIGTGGTLALSAPGPEVLHLPPAGPYKSGTVIYYGTVQGVDVWSGIRTEQGDRCLIVGNMTGTGTIQCGPLYSTPELSVMTESSGKITVSFPADGSPGTLTQSSQ